MEKSRVIVLTDIGEYSNEPDDAQSLVRLMLYSNEIDIEGIIPTASHCAPDIRDEGYMERCFKAVRAYKEAYPNLIRHAEGYPDPDALMQKIKRGTSLCYMEEYDYHISPEEQAWLKEDFMNVMMLRRQRILSGKYDITGIHVGEGCTNDGSRLIEEALEREDPRPVWFCLWGGAGTLAQALFDLRRKHTYAEMKSISEKVMVYDIDGQDDCGGWICKNFPRVTWLRSDLQFWGMSQRNIGGAWFENSDDSTVAPEWLREHIQSHGPLGAVYPDTKFGMETDSPSLLYTMRNGLNDPMRWWWGGWGGRYTADRSKNPPAVHFEGDYLIEPKPFFAYRDEVDSWVDPVTGRSFNKDPFSPVARWRTDYQYDMAVRMDWSVCDSYEQANHRPVAVVNGDESLDILQIHAAPGSRVLLDASASHDPDGDELSFRWYVYTDPSSYKGPVEIIGWNRPVATVCIPTDAENEEIHVILEVKDNGKGFPLKAYRRVVLTLGEGGFARTAPQTVNDADVNPSARAYFEYDCGWEHVGDQFGCNDFDIHTASEPGSTAVLHFFGRQVKLFGPALSNCGHALVSVDDGPEEIIDCYSALPPWENWREITMCPTAGETLLYCSKLLPRGAHRLTVRVAGKRNERASDCRVNIDKAEIFD